MKAETIIRFNRNYTDHYGSTMHKATYEMSYDDFVENAVNYTAEEAEDSLSKWENDDDVVVIKSHTDNSFYVADMDTLVNRWYCYIVSDVIRYIYDRR